jgi:ATP/maltotriose-dependent transcriptional regulator MalT
MLLVKAMNEGAFAPVKPDLIALRERARRLQLHAAQLLWNLDYGIFLCRTSDVSGLASRVRPRLKLSEHDSFHIRAGKIRSMVEFGLLEDAAEAMELISLAALDDLPRDQEYLAVLCHLSAGAAAANSGAQCSALLRMLSPYTEFYAASASFHCEGSVSSHLGMLCEVLGELEQAREHYAHGLEREHAFGLKPLAAVTGFRLARLLLRQGNVRRETLQLLEHVRSEAVRMGMRPLQQAVGELTGDMTAFCEAYDGAGYARDLLVPRVAPTK